MKLIALTLLTAVFSPSNSIDCNYPSCGSCVITGKINDISPLPEVPSGYLESWVKIVVVEKSGILHDTYIRHFDRNLKYPDVGSVCRIYYHRGDVKGVVGIKTLDRIATDVIVVDEFSCSK